MNKGLPAVEGQDSQSTPEGSAVLRGFPEAIRVVIAEVLRVQIEGRDTPSLGGVGKVVRYIDDRELKELRSVPRKQQVVWPEAIGCSQKLKDVYATAVELAKNSGGIILILGESGTGKDLVSRAIHAASGRKEEDYRTMDCGSFNSPQLFATMLFGTCKGAYTDAVEAEGALESYNRGTVFLDEIGQLELDSQANLLRVASETRDFSRVGGKKHNKGQDHTRLYFRGLLLAATSKDLEGMVEKGLFRADLLARLQLCSMTIPPLRERREDIPVLLDHFLREYGRKCGADKVEKEAWRDLLGFSWPANVRGIMFVAKRLSMGCKERSISRRDLWELTHIPRERELPALGTLSGNDRAVVEALQDGTLERLANDSEVAEKAAEELKLVKRTFERLLLKFTGLTWKEYVQWVQQNSDTQP